MQLHFTIRLMFPSEKGLARSNAVRFIADLWLNTLCACRRPCIPYPNFAFQRPDTMLIFALLTQRPDLIIPLFVQIVYQTILILVPPPSPPILMSERDATVPTTRRHEARARRREDDNHVLPKMSAFHGLLKISGVDLRQGPGICPPTWRSWAIVASRAGA